jgi:dTDP-D-glucose 4,6-dehydratase
MITRAMRAERLAVYGDGLYVCDWIHVEDHCRRSLADLGWTPCRSFEEGLASTIKWYRSHERWSRRIVSGDYLVDRRSAV